MVNAQTLRVRYLGMVGLVLVACGTQSGNTNTQGGTGGAGATGGSRTGGSSATGGVSSTGGVSQTGGVAQTGGKVSTGGTSSTGGVSQTGGRTGTGGSLPATGGATETGGTAGTGGVQRTGGGSPGTGGSSPATGGSAGTGGSSRTGGTSAADAGATGGTPGTPDGGSTSGSATYVPDPSWTCAMPDGIPDPKGGTLVFKVNLQVSGTHDVGNTQYGHRRLLDVKGGSVTGDKLTATVQTGGLELELTLSNGAVELEQINILSSGNTPMLMRNCGIAAPGDKEVRVVVDVEAPNSSSTLSWLNTAKLVGIRTLDASGNAIQLDVYDVSKVAASSNKVVFKDPAGVPNQPWDCVTGSGSNGTQVFTETVTLGGSVSIGASKRGSRNIIPITGGNVTGKVVGKVLPGGADYQITSGTMKLDARYTLAPNDGEFIIIRNCGPMGGLIPVFEAKTTGSYAFLNEGKFISSPPGSASGGVSITVYERK